MPDGKAIKNAILDGIHEANVRYEKWSRGWWVTDSGVEGHVVSTIAEKLYRRIAGQGSLAMELPFGIIRKASGATPPPGRPRKTLNSRNRADIVLRDMNDRPVCVIEVKRFWDEEKCFEDLVRIRNLILRCNRKKGGSLGRGFLGFMLAAWETDDMSAEQSLEIAERYIRQRVQTQFDREGLRMRCHTGPIRSYPKKYRKLHSEGKWAHASFCVELSLW